MRVTWVLASTTVVGTLAAACGGGSSTGSNRLNDPVTLASAIRDSAQHTIDHGTSGLPPGTRVTGTTCVNTRRLDYTCTVRFSTGGDRTVTATVSPGGRSYVVTSGDL